MIKYTPEMARWLSENVPGKNFKEATSLFNARFGTGATIYNIKSACFCRGIKNGIKPRKDCIGQRFGLLTVVSFCELRKNKNTYWNCDCDCGRKTVVNRYDLQSGHTQSCGCLRNIKFTSEIVAFIKKHCNEVACIPDLVSLVNRQFDTSFVLSQIKRIFYKKIKERRKTLPLLSEATQKDRNRERGCVFIKTEKGWKRKHIYVWEQKNGRVPEGHKIIFLDGDGANCGIENLACVPNQVVGYINSSGLRSTDAEYTKTGISIAELALGIKRRKKELPVPQAKAAGSQGASDA